jgi:hypothetical protein
MVFQLLFSISCKIEVSKVMATTPVGIYPNGASPHGCLDMAGNVSEPGHSQLYRPDLEGLKWRNRMIRPLKLN